MQKVLQKMEQKRGVLLQKYELGRLLQKWYTKRVTMGRKQIFGHVG